MYNRFLIIAGISGALSVALGAMGAHALKAVIAPELLQTYEKAVQYQVYHTFGLIAVALLMQSNPAKFLRWSGNLFIAGIVLFSGSLYFLSTRSLIGIEGMRWVGAITPFGGLSFITGWLFFSFSFLKKNHEL
ncbi:MAG: DUF423 domain-containing protein [Bacteroidetes bacterium]|nr:DUF423 domain-containing protein [Bacteroidota bacterium]